MNAISLSLLSVTSWSSDLHSFQGLLGSNTAGMLLGLGVKEHLFGWKVLVPVGTFREIHRQSKWPLSASPGMT